LPYRIDAKNVADDALDRLVALGALDVEHAPEHGIAALIPDAVTPEQVAHALGVTDIAVSPATGRDADSVWVLSPRPVHAGRLRIVPAHIAAEPGVLRLIDAAAFGTGLHPTTALCLEALDEATQVAVPDAVLDVGTGSGILALAALMLGVPQVWGVDIDYESLRIAEANASINGLGERLQLVRGGPEVVTKVFPLTLANVVAASLIEMAPALVRRVGHQGRLVLSGISLSLEHEVAETYRRLGMRRLDVKARGGWVALILEPSW
jgi:ribosomal protein L11 methyltransferase